MDENIVWVHGTSVVKYTSQLIDPDSVPEPFTGTTTRHIIETIYKALALPGVGMEVPTSIRDLSGENTAAGIHAVLKVLDVEHVIDLAKDAKWVLRITPMEKNMEKYRRKPFEYFVKLNRMKMEMRAFSYRYPLTEKDLPDFQVFEYRP